VEGGIIVVQLDSTAGYRKMWEPDYWNTRPNAIGLRLDGKITLIQLKADTHIADLDPTDVVFLDIRPECKPTVIGDAKHLPFKPHIFTDIWFDPPVIGKLNDHHDGLYSHFKDNQEWQQFTQHTNNEYHRTLQPNGILHYRHEYNQDKGNITPLYTNFKPTNHTNNPAFTNLQPTGGED
jgi:hypothetical protein